MPIVPLAPEKLRRVCSDNHFDFETTAELETANTIIGQPRGVRAIEFGIGIRSHGYNIYVLGEPGTGRTTAIKRFLREKTGTRPAPPDWVYVHNFAVPHQPRAIALPPGRGAAFKAEMTKLRDALQEELPKAFATDAYRDALDAIETRFSARKDERLQQLQQKAATQEFALLNTASGLTIAPVADGKVMSPEALDAMSVDQRQGLEEQQATLNDELEDVLYRVRQLDSEMRAETRTLRRQVAATAIEHHFDRQRQAYAEQADVVRYLEAMQQDVLDHLDDFLPDEDDEEQPEDTDPGLSRYEVNLLVDNGETAGAPVIVEPNPTYANLIGRVEYEMRYGVMSTHFTNLKAGSLHRANGGYLVLNARDIVSLQRDRHPAAWEALKRAVTGEEIRLQSPDSMDGAQVLAKSLDPEPIPLSVKVILLGNPEVYYTLYDEDEEFGELFKVKADFDSTMPRDDAHEVDYALFVANRCHEEGLRHFDRTAVEKVVEFGSRLSGDQQKLSTLFGDVAGLIREANYWAGQHGREVVAAQDVQQALDERIYRANQVEEHLREEIRRGLLLIATEGAVVGQVNGLSVLDMGDYAFGQPGRITARTYMGEDGVVNIEREVDMAGPIHNKGLLTLVGYLGGTYAQTQPLSLSATLTFEQNYSDIDGDSAAAAELCALLSSLSEIPVRQSVAMTGSINQRGDMQPVGGVTEKIEGFFAVCKERGLTGAQGVVIPQANVSTLMLHEEVVDAVRRGQFHVWAVASVDEGIELVMDTPAGERGDQGNYPPGTVHHAVQKALLRLATELKAFGDQEKDEE